MNIKHILILCVVFLGSKLQGQLTLKGGAEWYVMEQGLFFVSDSVHVEPQGVFSSNGTLVVNGHLKNEGTLLLNDTTSLSGNLIQNGAMTHGPNSVFRLAGADQDILGTGEVAFTELRADGDGLKTLFQSVSCSRLNLGDCRINTQGDSLLVLGELASDLSYGSGWVYSSLNGGLFRTINANEAFVFPVGSAERYRPLVLQSALESGLVGARFSESASSADGIPLFLVAPGICRVDSQFYFRLYGDLGSATVTTVFEPEFTAQARPWATATPSGLGQWTALAELPQLQNDSVRVSFNVNLQDGLAIAPYFGRPDSPVILGPDTLCFGSSGVQYEAENPNDEWDYLWSASGGLIFGTSTNTAFTVNWSSAPVGNVSLIISDSLGCSSFPASLNVYFHPLPEADITVTLPVFPHTGEMFEFSSTSSGADFYSWDFGNGEGSFLKDPQEDFDNPGVYAISLIVSNLFGCRDTAYETIEIPEELIFPDAFSPNGDGINDQLEIKASGMDVYSLVIFDRWGAVVFESNSDGFHWDGRNAQGNRMPAGTYFVLLRAQGKTKLFEIRRGITLFD